jgi:hypothetical protein
MAILSMLPSVRGLSSFDPGMMTETLIFHLLAAVAESIANMYTVGLGFGVSRHSPFLARLSYDCSVRRRWKRQTEYEAVDSGS